jgi:DNA-binding transcriptional LysR family regulator
VATYSLEALKKNRVSVLAFGGSEADRRALAQAAALELPGAGLIEARDAAAVASATGNGRAVVYVPDVAALPADAQRALVRALREKEERPKFVLGLGTTPETAFEKGVLTEDLRFWLATSTVDVRAKVASRR